MPARETKSCVFLLLFQTKTRKRPKTKTCTVRNTMDRRIHHEPVAPPGPPSQHINTSTHRPQASGGTVLARSTIQYQHLEVGLGAFSSTMTQTIKSNKTKQGNPPPPSTQQQPRTDFDKVLYDSSAVATRTDTRSTATQQALSESPPPPAPSLSRSTRSTA